MSNLPERDDFNWVKALTCCSVQFEFEKLKCDIKNGTAQRNSNYPDGSSAWITHEEHSIIQVSRTKPESIREPKPSVVLKSEGDCIKVTGFGHEESMKLTVTLNDEGKCRFQINGKGLYRRWQVIRRALEAIFFKLHVESNVG